MKQKKKRQHGKTAIEVIEEAVYLLRFAPSSLIACYYIGSLPFIIALLFFWTDMSRGAFADRHCTAAALGVALLFIWMKCWQTIFIAYLKNHLFAGPSAPWTFRRILRVAVIQTIFQSTGFIVMPLALIVMFPLGSAFAFYQNCLFFGNGAGDDLKEIFRKSCRYAVLWPGQNHILILIFFILCFIIFINLAYTVFLIPWLVKVFLGIETIFTRSTWSMLNTTFFATICGLTYLCIDPVVKAVYLLRCFYGESLNTGADLKVELRALKPQAGLLIICIFLLSLCNPAYAFFSNHDNQTQQYSVCAPELDRKISEVINQPEYSWRMPRQKVVVKTEKKQSALLIFIEEIGRTLKSWVRSIVHWLKKVNAWFKKFFPDRSIMPPGWSLDSKWVGWLYIFTFGLLGLLSSVLGITFYRMWKQRRKMKVTISSKPLSAVPDIMDEKVSADELPADRWLTLARHLMEKGEARLALRAFYLASLSYLAQNELITIASFKSNHDYDRELRRRVRDTTSDMPDAFKENINIFESIWYGMHEITHEMTNVFNRNQERIGICGTEQ